MTSVEGRVAAARDRLRTLAPQQMARIDWSRDQLEAYRETRLREMLAHAQEHSAWHGERLSHLEPETFEIGDLPALPIMTKANLIEGLDEISTDPRITRTACERHLESGRLLLDDEFNVTASGGTTGMRAVSAIGLDSLVETAGAGLIRFVMRWGMRTELIERPEPPFMIVSAPGHQGSDVLKRILGGGTDQAVSVVDPIDRVVAALNEANPAHVIVYSSFIPHLAEEARAGRLRIRPKILTPVAESVLPEHESAVAEVWDCVLMSLWGATETGMLGAGSGFDSGMLLLDDEVIIEPVDADDEPVPPGVEADKVLVTNLSPRVVPMIRYELTDQLTVLDEPASCGSAFTRVSYVRGRQDDGFVYPGGVAVHAHTFRSVLSAHRAIAEYQVEQTAGGAHVRARLSSGTGQLDREHVAAQLVDRLARIGLHQPQVQISIVSEIPRTTGAAKLRRFVPRPHSA